MLSHVTIEYLFLDPIARPPRGNCALIIPPGGSVSGEPKIGIRHLSKNQDQVWCPELADLCIEYDAFFCSSCGRNGRVSGQWCTNLMGARDGLPRVPG